VKPFRLEAEARSRGVTAMRGKGLVGMVFWLVMVVMPGCASMSDARYVYQDGEFGVVAIPRNTPEGAEHYREQAEALMARHFPQGYQIVRAEEVVEGSRTLTVGTAGSTEVTPQVAPHLLAILKIGASVTRNQADTRALRECRIIYKKADPHEPAGAGKFASESALNPTCYVDPNRDTKKPDEAALVKKEEKPVRASEMLVGE
jgi:hypothetical protein